MSSPAPTNPKAPAGAGPTAAPAGLSPAQAGRARNAYRAYQKAQIDTASPAQLILLLYDGAIRFCHQGVEAMEARSIETQNTNLLKAQRIITELIGSLNREVGGDVADNLFRVYTFMLKQLVHANLYDKPDEVRAVISMLNGVRASWQEAAKIVVESNLQPQEQAAPDAPTGMQHSGAYGPPREQASRLGDRNA